MTGRTNVGGGGTALNADVEPKIVKSGSITAGDFVNYYTENSYIPFSNYFYFLANIGDYTVGTSPNRSSGSLVLIKNNEILSRYSTYTVEDIASIGNYIAVSSGKMLLIIGIQNDTLVLVDSHEFSKNIKFLEVANNKIVAFLAFQTYYDTCAVCQISQNGQIQGLAESSVSTYMQNSYGPDLRYYNGWYYMLSLSSSGSSYNFKFQVNANNQIENFASTYSLPGSDSKSFLYQKDSKVLYWGSSSTTNYYWVELTTGAYTFVNGINGIAVTRISEDRLFLAKPNTSSYIVELFSFDDESVEVTLLSSLNSSGYYGSMPLGMCWLKGNNACIRNSDGGQYCVEIADIVNNTLTHHQNKNYVKPYAGGIEPIGVAKDSGRTNDIIDVYVPTPIS